MPTPPTTASLASSVQGVALRVTSLNSDGTAVTGTTSAYTMNRFVTAQFTPVYAGSTNVRQQLANGNFAVTYQTSDIFQNINVVLHIAGPDPEFNEIAIGGTILTETVGGTVIGWKPTAPGAVDVPNGVALEIWSYAISGSRPAVDYPYYQWLLPRVFLHPSDNMVVDNNAMTWNASGWGNDNPAFAGTGVGAASGATSWKYQSDRPYQYARVTDAPINVNGYELV